MAPPSLGQRKAQRSTPSRATEEKLHCSTPSHVGYATMCGIVDGANYQIPGSTAQVAIDIGRRRSWFGGSHVPLTPAIILTLTFFLQGWLTHGSCRRLRSDHEQSVSQRRVSSHRNATMICDISNRDAPY
jgi:hypothetical protein